MPRFSVEIRERNGDLSIYEMRAEAPENSLDLESEPDIGELPYWADMLPTPRSYQIATWLTGFSLVAVFG